MKGSEFILANGRQTSYHVYDAEGAWDKVNPHNKMIVEEYLINLGATGKSKKTIKVYTHNLKLFFQWVLEQRENKEFYKLKKRDYSAWLNYLVNTQKLSSARVRVLRSTVSSLSNFCENVLAEDEDFEEYEDYRNAILKIAAPALSTVRKKTFLTKEQIDKLVELLIEKEDYQKALYVVLSFTTGARKAEIAQILVSDFDKVFENKGKAYYKTHPIRCKGKGLEGTKREFTIMKDEVYSFLRAWLNQRKMMGVPDSVENLFILNSKNGWYPVKSTTFNSWCDTFTELLGVPVYPHAFRSSIATYFVNVEKKEMSKVQSLLGHKSMETTQHYIEDTSQEDIFDLFD